CPQVLTMTCSLFPLFFPLIQRPQPFTLFPYTTLFRSAKRAGCGAVAGVGRISAACPLPDNAESVVDQAGAGGDFPFHLGRQMGADRKSTRLNSSHVKISYAVFCLKKKNKNYYRQ